MISFHLVNNSIILNLISPLNFISNIVMIFIRDKKLMPLNRYVCLFLLHKLRGISETSLIVATSRHGCIILRVYMITLYLFPCSSQYQFVFAFIMIKYTALTMISPALMTCLFTVLFLCNVYGSSINFTT